MPNCKHKCGKCYKCVKVCFDPCDPCFKKKKKVGPTGPTGPVGPTGPTGPTGGVQSAVIPYATPLSILTAQSPAGVLVGFGTSVNLVVSDASPRIEYVAPRAGILRSLRVRITGIVGPAFTLDVTVLVNGVGTTLAIAIPIPAAPSIAFGINTTDSIPVAPNDIIGLFLSTTTVIESPILIGVSAGVEYV